MLSESDPKQSIIFQVDNNRVADRGAEASGELREQKVLKPCGNYSRCSVLFTRLFLLNKHYIVKLIYALFFPGLNTLILLYKHLWHSVSFENLSCNKFTKSNTIRSLKYKWEYVASWWWFECPYDFSNLPTQPIVACTQCDLEWWPS